MERCRFRDMVQEKVGLESVLDVYNRNKLQIVWPIS